MAKFPIIIAAKTSGEGQIKRMGNSMQGVQGKVKNLKMAVGGLTAAFKALAVILAAGAFTKFVKGAIDQADAFGKLSSQTGIAADTLQSYVNAGKLAGVEQVTIDKALRRLAQSMREADQGINTYQDSFNALGISVRDAQGNFKSSEQVLNEISDRFRDMPDGATKAALAMELFSRQGAGLIPLLNSGSEAMNKWNYATSEGFAQNAEYFNDQLTMMRIGFDGFRKQLSDALLPALNAIVEVFRELFSADNDYTALFNGIEIAIRGIATAVYVVIRLFDEMLRAIGVLAKRIQNAIDSIVSRVPPWLIKLMGGAGNILKGAGEGAVNLYKGGMEKIYGEDFVEGLEGRLEGDMEKINKLFSGKSNAPAEYFREGRKEAGLLQVQLDKTFGGSMLGKLKDFSRSMEDLGGQIGDVVVKSLKSMEDSLVDFVMTGKLSFKDLANSIIRDMIRITIQQSITKPLTGAFSSLLGGIFSPTKSAKGNVFSGGNHLTAYAKGGVVDSPTMFAMGGAGKFGIMGEGSGPEAILPLKRRNGVLGVEGGGGTNVVVNVDASGTEVQGNENEGKMLGQLIAAAVQSTIIKEQRPGGLLAPA
tara:strand:+ start:684 stop:2456 length:1773 start_codon:yes stop_codon:yes gene_type:complete